MKNLKNLGKTLTKAEQKEVNGGQLALNDVICYTRHDTSEPCQRNYYVSTEDATEGQCCAHL